jgi:hypothetical protein
MTGGFHVRHSIVPVRALLHPRIPIGLSWQALLSTGIRFFASTCPLPVFLGHDNA